MRWKTIHHMMAFFVEASVMTRRPSFVHFLADARNNPSNSLKVALP
jgi:hypothetical protein